MEELILVFGKDQETVIDEILSGMTEKNKVVSINKENINEVIKYTVGFATRFDIYEFGYLQGSRTVKDFYKTQLF